MELPMAFSQLLIAHMGIYLGSPDIAMAKQFLDYPQIRSTPKQVGCKGVPQGVHLAVKP